MVRLKPGEYTLPKKEPKVHFTGKYDFAFKGKWINLSLLNYESPKTGETKQFEAVGRPFFVNAKSDSYEVTPLAKIYGGVDVVPIAT